MTFSQVLYYLHSQYPLVVAPWTEFLHGKHLCSFQNEPLEHWWNDL